MRVVCDSVIVHTNELPTCKMCGETLEVCYTIDGDIHTKLLIRESGPFQVFCTDCVWVIRDEITHEAANVSLGPIIYKAGSLPAVPQPSHQVPESGQADAERIKRSQCFFCKDAVRFLDRHHFTRSHNRGVVMCCERCFLRLSPKPRLPIDFNSLRRHRIHRINTCGDNDWSVTMVGSGGPRFDHGMDHYGFQLLDKDGRHLETRHKTPSEDEWLR